MGGGQVDIKGADDGVVHILVERHRRTRGVFQLEIVPRIVFQTCDRANVGGRAVCDDEQHLGWLPVAEDKDECTRWTRAHGVVRRVELNICRSASFAVKRENEVHLVCVRAE